MSHFAYMPYRVFDETLDKKMRALTASSTENPRDLRDLRQICTHLCNSDIDRITTISRWNPPHGDYNAWRASCRTWRDREARFVLETLRWEYYQHYTLALLWLDRKEMVETNSQHDKMAVDEPSCGRDIAARNRTPSVRKSSQQVDNDEDDDDGDGDDDEDVL